MITSGRLSRFMMKPINLLRFTLRYPYKLYLHYRMLSTNPPVGLFRKSQIAFWCHLHKTTPDSRVKCRPVFAPSLKRFLPSGIQCAVVVTTTLVQSIRIL
jgi:hypothetical protein